MDYDDWGEDTTHEPEPPPETPKGKEPELCLEVFRTKPIDGAAAMDAVRAMAGR